MTNLLKGTIVDFNLADGWGYIRPSNTDNEVFFNIDDMRHLGHFSGITDSELAIKLKEGEVITVENLPIIFNEEEGEWEVTTEQQQPAQQHRSQQAPIIRADDEQPDFSILYEPRSGDTTGPIRKTPRAADQRQQSGEQPPDAQWQGAASDVGNERRAIPAHAGQAAQPTAANAERITGEVKFFDPKKGYGFILRDDGNKDVFVHSTQTERSGITLVDGMRVSFETIPSVGGRSGLQAVNIKQGGSELGTAHDVAAYQGTTGPNEKRPVVVVKRTTRKPPPGTEGQS